MAPEMNSSGKRISEIELMRFIAALMIVCLHFNKYIFTRGWIMVEFFFILSGLLMAQSATKVLNNRKDIEVGVETKTFMIGKIKTLLPYLLIAYGVMGVGYLINAGITSTSISGIINQIPDYLFLMMGGFEVTASPFLLVTWYVSAMVIGLLILFPIYLRFNNTAKYVIMPLIFIFTIGFLINNAPKLDVHTLWMGAFNAGLLRGLGDMALGAFCFEICVYLKKLDLTVVGKVAFTVLKILLIVMTALWAMGKLPDVKDFVMIFIIAGMVILLYSEHGYHIPRGNRLCYYLGLISLPLFLLHPVVQRIISIFIGTEQFNEHIPLMIAIAVIVSIITILFVSILQRRGSKC